MRTVQLRDESIRLGQFLKYADLVDSGSDARLVLGEGRVTVNGVVELRRGRKVMRGDVVDFAGSVVRVG
ncbi:MAG: RNA-binding S4 domain-containing protein [Nocardioidaceae bacterium]